MGSGAVGARGVELRMEMAAYPGEAKKRWVLRQNAVTAALLLPAVLFLGVWFLIPMGKLFQLSMSAPEGALSAYRELLGNAVYRQVFTKTLLLSVNVTVISVVLAYPTAYILSRLKGAALTAVFYCVLFPFWTSVLVRTFSWILLLERNGPINDALVGLGLVSQPVSFLFNDLGVYIGMVHVLLPYALLPIYASMLGVDERLLLASEGMGASPFTTFIRIYLPLTLPGVAAGGAFVFLLALGFFITPALLGGLQNLTVAMLIDLFVSERLVWSLAAAASFCLLFIILGLIVVASRFLRLGRFLVLR